MNGYSRAELLQMDGSQAYQNRIAELRQQLRRPCTIHKRQELQATLKLVSDNYRRAFPSHIF